MLTKLSLSLIVSLLLTPLAPAQDRQLIDMPVVSHAQHIALAWLAINDAGKYSEAYNQMCEVAKHDVPSTQWINVTKTNLDMLGGVEGRELNRIEWVTQLEELPHQPKGEFIVLHFNARTKSGAVVFETVSTMKTAEGDWKVCGHFIAPGSSAK